MPVTLDLTALKTPPRSGDVLIEPGYDSFGSMIESNLARSKSCDITICGVAFDEYRRMVREALALSVDRPIIAHGYQPEFYHCGVWAKGVVCQRLANDLGAEAVDVLIDYDKVKQRHLQVPSATSGLVRVTHVPIEEKQTAAYFEQLPAWNEADCARFGREVAEANAEVIRSSVMPILLDGFRRVRAPRDWVSQFGFATQLVDQSFGIAPRRVRAGEIDFGCFLADLLANARRFATSYNKALEAYRRQFGIKGTRHPIPNLYVEANRVELPIWIFDERGIRHRLHVRDQDDLLQVLADDQVVESYAPADWRTWSRAESRLLDLTTAYRIRPRALSFTIWARLFLSDFFIHGIGGAKYDRIADGIIREYFGIEPPEFCCVSASLWLEFPRYDVGHENLLRVRHQLRDTQWNPQRHAVGADAARELISARENLVNESLRLQRETPRDHGARIDTFQKIRSINQRLTAYCEGQIFDTRERCSTLEWQLKSNQAANSREYFYGLFPREQLAGLQARLLESCDGG
ncbi:MAG: hypothetical protein IID34_04140 [Planctomycetes bacterium]|nr:hypothetical protein [Planctomycetota bacterium]